MGKNNLLISIVIPCYNEESNINTLYSTLKDVLEKNNYSFELVFVNDGSKDNTLKLLLEAHQKDNRVKVIDLSRNFGKELALSAGLDFASGDCVIPFDADLQDPAEIIPKLIEKYQEGYEIVNAVRTKREGETRLKKATSNLFYKIFNKFSSTKLEPNVGDFRLISRPALEVIKKMPERCRFMKGIFSWVGFNSTSVEFVRKPRNSGKTKWSYLRLIDLAINGITSFSTFPLRLAFLLGTIVSFFGFIYAIYIILQKIIFGNSVKGYPSIIVALLFLGGIELIVLGVVGEYIGKIYEEVKQRPLYVVKRIWNDK
jgi:glycosyltransferase involved in cell wall biosynthesis